MRRRTSSETATQPSGSDPPLIPVRPEPGGRTDGIRACPPHRGGAVGRPLTPTPTTIPAWWGWAHACSIRLKAGVMKAYSAQQRRFLRNLGIVIFVAAFILAALGILPRAEAAVPPTTTPAPQVITPQSTNPGDGGKPSYREGTKHVKAAGLIGGRARVPAVVRARIIRSVNAKGGAYAAHAHHFSWWHDGVWFVNCAALVAANQMIHKQYLRCVSPKYMSIRWKHMRHFTWACAQTAIVFTGVGGLSGATKGLAKEGASVGAIGGAAACEVDHMVDQARADMKAVYVGPNLWKKAIHFYTVRRYSNLPSW